MKYETRIWIFLCIILICILGIIVKETVFRPHFLEGARTMPRPTRHAYKEEDNQVSQQRPSVKQLSMNEWIDQTISTYFDENNVPYTNVINLYTNYCVSQGLTTDENKRRLKDLCFYIIDYVIPSLPSVDNLNPSVILPPIEFNSTNFNAYNYNASGLANEAYNYWANNPAPLFPPEFSSALNGVGPWDSSGSTTYDGSSNIPGSKGTSGSSSSSSSSGSGGCGTSCPSACLGNMVNTMNSANGTNGTNGGLNGFGSFDVSLSFQYSMFTITPFDIYSLADQINSPSAFMGHAGYLITNQPNLTPNPNTLNSNIESLFSTYFDFGNTNAPTPYALGVFDFFAKHYLPVDDPHKNKLRDLIYYIMEQIIPGLPTDSHPYSYVEWKPIRWLSHSSL